MSGSRPQHRIPAAVADYVRSQASPLLAYAVLLTGDQPAAENLVTEAFADLATSWRWARHRDLGRFVRGRLVRRYLRRYASPLRFRVATPAGARPSADHLPVLAGLGPRDRVVAVEVLGLGGGTLAEVAELLDTSPRSVQSALARVRGQLAAERRG